MYNENYDGQNPSPYYEQTENGWVNGVNVAAKHQSEIVSQVLYRSYLFMLAVLVISSLSAFLTYETGFFITIVSSRGLFYAILGTEIGIVIVANWVLSKGNEVVGAIMLLAYSIVNGMTLSFVFAVYTAQSISGVFVVAAVMFGSFGIFGLVTKKDLSTIGRIAYMSLFAIIIFSVLNLFIFHNQGTALIIDVAVLILFIGITAYDTQKIRVMANHIDESRINNVAMMGALTLYLDFINIFLRLLSLFGNRK